MRTTPKRPSRRLWSPRTAWPLHRSFSFILNYQCTHTQEATVNPPYVYRYADDPEATFSSFMVTENGVADSTDVLRPAFITEHLAAIAAAIHSGEQI